MNTVLITGCSSGFGLDTARWFLDRDWTVVATMRTPREDLLPASGRLRILPLDVTDAESIARAVEAAGAFDVLVNNTGVGMVGPLEGVSMDKVRELFETNTLGTIAMTQAVLPQFRERGSGVIVNVTSGVTFQPLALMSIYTASKAAVNAFTESLALELEPLGVRVRIVIPGRAPETPFGENARGRMGMNIPEPYAAIATGVFARFQAGGPVTYSRDVAEAVWRAATDPACPMRLPAGADAVATGFSPARLAASTRLLASDLQRNLRTGWTCEVDAPVDGPMGRIVAPILVTDPTGKTSVIALSGPLTDGQPADPSVARLHEARGPIAVHVENELVVRRNLPFATRDVLQKIQ